MKKILILTIAALAFACTEASAQSWLDALKSAASTAIDKVTGGKLTEKAIVGTWSYTQPGVKLSSSDTLSELAASAASSTMQSKLATYYTKVGIKAGTCSFTFNSDGTFTSKFGQKSASGTYTFDASTYKLSLKYNSGIFNMGAIPAYAYMNGSNLQIVFPMDKLLTILTSLGSSIDSLSTITTLLQKYDSVKIGFEFKK
ncbi:MAG: DUF4923 family protein [Alistipes sp.]|nr:DUF4923 family protein [Alistipes sp.]